jgi:hypothetical protein
MTTRTVGIAGGGNMARAIARRLTAAGRAVVIFDRNSESAAKVAAEAGEGQPGSVTARGADEVLAANVIVIASGTPAAWNSRRLTPPGWPARSSWTSPTRSMRPLPASASIRLPAPRRNWRGCCPTARSSRPSIPSRLPPSSTVASTRLIWTPTLPQTMPAQRLSCWTCCTAPGFAGSTPAGSPTHGCWRECAHSAWNPPGAMTPAFLASSTCREAHSRSRSRPQAGSRAHPVVSRPRVAARGNPAADLTRPAAPQAAELSAP